MNQYPVKKGRLVQSETAEGWTVYEPETDSLHILNASAKAIWELCDGSTSNSEMARAISELTGIELEDAQHDVETTLRQLRRLALISN